MYTASEFADLNYWLEIFFSIGIATLGLIINSPAVVIGAMLISPLMGPILGSGLAIALGDFYFGIRAMASVLLSSLVSILLAASITWVLPFRAPTSEILARVQPTLLDLGVAVLSGMAGAVVICRGGKSGGVTALPGVAVAVALMPPLGVVGFGVGIGWNWEIISGGGLLYLTNLVAIILSSFLVFFSVRMDTRPVRQEINAWLEEHERADRLYEAIQRTPLRNLLGRVGSLPRRVLILFLFLAIVSWPLGQALARLREEANLRRIVLDEIQAAIPRDAIVQQTLELPRTLDRVQVRILAVMPEGFTAGQRRRLQERIELRAGRPAQVIVIDMATREEVEELTGRLAGRAPAPVDSLDELRARLMGRVRPAIASAWPSDRAPLAGYRFGFAPESAALQIHLAYLSEQELGELGEEAVRRGLRERAGVAVEVVFERVTPLVTVPFAARTASLGAAARERLDTLAVALRRFPHTSAAVQIPSADDGQPGALPQQRAAEARRYLVEERRIAAERVRQQSVAEKSAEIIVRLIPPAQP